MIKTRTAVNRRRAKKAKENNEKALEYKSIETETPLSAPSCVIDPIVAMNNNAADNDLMKETDILKTPTNEVKKEDEESIKNLIKKLKLSKRRRKK